MACAIMSPILSNATNIMMSGVGKAAAMSNNNNNRKKIQTDLAVRLIVETLFSNSFSRRRFSLFAVIAPQG